VNGNVQGLRRSWRTATVQRQVSERPQVEACEDIKRQLVEFKLSPVTVDHIELVYYDGNKDFLQPVYRFRATIHHQPSDIQEPLNGDEVVIGYVPYADPISTDPLPILGDSRSLPDSSAQCPEKAAGTRTSDPTGKLLVGRYVIRTDDGPSDWDKNAGFEIFVWEDSQTMTIGGIDDGPGRTARLHYGDTIVSRKRH
jgi:hypothetical protein